MYENLEHPLKQKHLMMIMPQSFSSSQKQKKNHRKKMKMKIKVHKALASLWESFECFSSLLSKKSACVCAKH